MIIAATLEHGLFGQVLTWLLEVLPFVDRANTGLTCQIANRNYGVAPDFDCLSRHLDSVRPHNGSSSEPIHLRELKQTHGTRFYDFDEPNRLWNKYFSFKPHILEDVERLVDLKFFGVTLGIHYRGCDKMEGPHPEGGFITYEDMDIFIEDHCNSSPKPPDSLFVSSDETDYIEHIHRKYGHQLNVVHRPDSARNDKAAVNPLFYWSARTAAKRAQQPALDPIALGADAICNSLLLSRCDVVLKTSSALSAWSKIFNPKLDVFRVNAFLHNWYPDAAVPKYASTSPAVQKILTATMKGDATNG